METWLLYIKMGKNGSIWYFTKFPVTPSFMTSPIFALLQFKLICGGYHQIAPLYLFRYKVFKFHFLCCPRCLSCEFSNEHCTFIMLDYFWVSQLVGQAFYPWSQVFPVRRYLRMAQTEVKLSYFAGAQSYGPGEERSNFGVQRTVQDSTALYFPFELVHAPLGGTGSFIYGWPIYKAPLFENAIAFK